MPPPSTPSPLLSDDQHGAVLALVERAAAVDGARALSEQSVLALHRSGSSHRLRYADAELAGYAQLTDGSAELVVDPGHRRRGVGSQLLQDLPDDVRVWAHGDVPAAEAFAQARDLTVVRELWVLHRRLDEPPALVDVVLPQGLTARSFETGRDEDEWVRVNAAAFAHHPEQGRMTRADLETRMAEPWFEAAGLLLVVPADDPDRVAAFHWTKVHEAGEKGPARVGEVYVVGVDPAYQGRGLGRPVTLLGLHHLVDLGLQEVILYVDGDNPAALRVYRSLGFTPRSVDRMYAHTRNSPVRGAQSSVEGGTMTP